MSTDRPLSRREVLAAGAGLTLAFALPTPALAGEAAVTRSGRGLATAWVHVAIDESVTIRVPACEMGQGSMTTQALILAEELDADWNRVRIDFAPPDDETFGNPVFWAFGIMITAGSTGVQAYYERLRRCGAQARCILLENAATHWAVPVPELTTSPGVVLHGPTGRRLTYGQIAAFATVPAVLPEVRDTALKDPATFRLIGHDLPRRDIPPKTRGAAVYSIDVELPGMVYASVLHPLIAGQTPFAVEDRAAQAIPGVLRIVRLPHAVAVVAASSSAAFAAERALEVTWTAATTTADSDALLVGHAAAAEDMSLAGFMVMDEGDALAGLQKARRRFRAQYRSDPVYHAQLEPQNAVARLDSSGTHAEVWAGTQTPTHLVRAASAALGIPATSVTLHRTLIGGGFGSRLEQAHRPVVDAVLLAREMKRPVKVIWSRETDVRCGRCKPLTAHDLQAGEDESGEITSWLHRLASDEPLRQSDPFRYQEGHGYPSTSSPGASIPYDIVNRRAEVIRQETGVRLSPLRGVGVTPNRFAVESFVDEIALARRADPLELRLRLLRGQPAAQHVLRSAAERSGWGTRPGLGLSFVDTNGTLLGTVVDVNVDERTGLIHVRDVWATLDAGLVVQPRNVLAQLEGAIHFGVSNALKERISLSAGVVQQANYHDYPVLRMAEAPRIHGEIVASARAPTGCGEIGAMGVVPAIANAFAARTGRRLRHLPFLPERVLAALHD
ncbi:MAG: molybdopterin cofactor-binding domain-containing protein [Steroidobacteraceae bacterium]